MINKNNPLKPVFHVLRQTNLIIFVIVVGVGIAMYIFTISDILLKAQDSTTSITKTNNPLFDKSLITKIESLKTSSNITTSSLPAGRINPLDE